jgi:hypothetical protein
MKKLLVAMISLAFLLVPAMVYTQSEQLASNAPPVSQPLVPEGDFALKLAMGLKLGTPTSEAQAEDMLSSVGIAPRNGWIADYPVTPDIIGELRNAVAAAADAQKLSVGKEEALEAFQDVTAEFGLAVVPGSPGQYAENQPQMSPTAIGDYYYDEGPPVITYYPPPWDYYYLYAWVPYPFWWGGFYFPGFFCLNDFHRVVFVGHRRCVVSNHFFDHKTKRVSTIDPVRRGTREAFRTADISRNRGFNSTEAKRGAASIFERSIGRGSSIDGRTATTGNSAGKNHSSVGKQNGTSLQGSAAREGRSFNSPSVTSGRSFSQSSTSSGSFKSSQSSGRSFNAPNRALSGSSSGGGSFSCTNCHGGSSSFGRSGGGSSSRSFSGGGFSGGHSFGGFSGGGGGFSGGRGGGRGR